MEFSTWFIRSYGGLSLHDFRVLDDGNTSSAVVREAFRSWSKIARPEQIAKAIKDAEAEGFFVNEEE